jgi:hypothetical protein
MGRYLSFATKYSREGKGYLVENPLELSLRMKKVTIYLLGFRGASEMVTPKVIFDLLETDSRVYKVTKN